ncbi:MAG: hypothetical protein R3A12_16480 [Ignavibacteria bacterium]
MKREQAYKIVQTVAMKCWKEKISFYKLLSEDSRGQKISQRKELKEIFNYDKSRKNVDFIFRRVGIK